MQAKQTPAAKQKTSNNVSQEKPARFTEIMHWST